MKAPKRVRGHNMKKRSAGILMYRRSSGEIFLLLVHPGGPFWAKKDRGAWSIPKGEYLEEEDPFAAALREFGEEMGTIPEGEFVELGELTQPSKKEVRAWAVEGDFDVASLKSNTFEIEWPPKSGQQKSFPEVDRAEWFRTEDARAKILPGQAEFIDRLLERISFANQRQEEKQLSLF
jgi:predicted NUDIX family NTP pyrophosphohydrolase